MPISELQCVDLTGILIQKKPTFRDIHETTKCLKEYILDDIKELLITSFRCGNGIPVHRFNVLIFERNILEIFTVEVI